jgi:hypothetical protein
MEYTVEVYLADRRFKEGEHLINKHDLKDVTQEQAEQWGPNCYAKDYSRTYRFEVHQTWIERRNFMTNQPIKERYDTPWCSSVASETYWSM